MQYVVLHNIWKHIGVGFKRKCAAALEMGQPFFIGLTLGTKAFESPNIGKLTVSTTLIKLNICAKLLFKSEKSKLCNTDVTMFPPSITRCVCQTGKLNFIRCLLFFFTASNDG